MTIKERIEGTVGNMEFQKGFAMWDDIEKLEHVLALVIQGKSLQDDFEFVPDHLSVIQDHFKKIQNQLNKQQHAKI
jgi:hypothetical protein